MAGESQPSALRNGTQPPAAAGLSEALAQGFVAVGFQSPEQALANVVRLTARLPEALMRSVLRLLADSPNPDFAVNLLERLLAQPDDLPRVFGKYPQLLHYALTLFASSQYLGETLIQNPDLLHGFIREEALGRTQSAEDFAGSFARFRSRAFETDFPLLLTRFKRREYVRIVLRDLLGIATLAETTAEISALTDVLIEEALRVCQSNVEKRYGFPQHYDAEGRLVSTRFTVLSLGKLGGNELNYSSDIDLLYIFEEGRDAENTKISGREYFVRLAQELTDILGRITREGPLFRIDLRLRPRGTEGELAIRLDRALHYYGEVAHDWELQALIKVRHSAGSNELARRFIRQVQGFVYRGEINFRAIETALESLHKIKRHSRRALSGGAAAVDVKIDRGGIRDIEFLVQCLQRVYGGAEPWLRSGGTLFSMQKLHDKGHLSGTDFHVLSASYSFLRQVEHRLQIWLGQQTHRLPTDEHLLRAIYLSLNPNEEDAAPGALHRAVSEQMQAAATIYQRIIHQQQTVQEVVAAAPAEAHTRVVRHWAEQTDAQILSRLAVDAPTLWFSASSLPLGSVARRNLFRVLAAAAGEEDRYAALMKQPELIERAIPVLAASALVTDILVRHPEDVAELAGLDDESSDAAPPASRGEITGAGGNGSQSAVANQELSPKVPHPTLMPVLRSDYRRQVLRSAVRDFLHPRSIWESVTQLSGDAEGAIRRAFAALDAPDGCAVFALGRLGTGEFDVLSDADLLFVRAEDASSEQAAAAAASLLTLLASYTSEGIVFTVDMRLRPHGSQGELAITPSQLARYFQSEGQAWEALSYSKLRLVAGSARVAADVFDAVRSFHDRFAGDATFRPQLREMRERLENSVPRGNFKKGWGGFYDIDYIASTLAIEHRLRVPACDILGRLRSLAKAGLLSTEDCAALCRVAEFLRLLEHALRLVSGAARNRLPAAQRELEAITAMLRTSLGRAWRLDRPLPELLEELLATDRELYTRIFGL